MHRQREGRAQISLGFDARISWWNSLASFALGLFNRPQYWFSNLLEASIQQVVRLRRMRRFRQPISSSWIVVLFLDKLCDHGAMCCKFEYSKSNSISDFTLHLCISPHVLDFRAGATIESANVWVRIKSYVCPIFNIFTISVRVPCVGPSRKITFHFHSVWFTTVITQPSKSRWKSRNHLLIRFHVRCSWCQGLVESE